MSREPRHLTDRELILFLDSELPFLRAARVHCHLAMCRACRARRANLEQAVADFVRLYRSEVGRERASVKVSARSSRPAVQIHFAGALLLAVILTAMIATVHRPRIQVAATPDISLTPGAIRPVSLQNVCAAQIPMNDPAVPDSLKREVLKKYGLKDVSDNGYQIDYLVTPELGGDANIRNLWPEPKLNTVWNARVKDALEDRLHSLVCSGQIDLVTAQREISQDWIGAYKKYFHTNQPLPEHVGARGISMRKREVTSPLARFVYS